MTDSRHLDPDPDLVVGFIELARDFGPIDTDERAIQFDALVRAMFGGLRVRVAKRRKHPTQEQRARIALEAINSTATDEELAKKHGISRRTLYYYLKRGTGG